MCGIAGVMQLDGAAVDPALVEAMRDTLEHRGPDDCGIFGLEHARIGHRRLSIIDPRGGHQPLFNEDGSVAVVVNGEIYNFRELRTQLQARGHRFATNSDSEVVVHLYEEEGPRMVERLRGMFAIALLDTRTGQLVLARDRLGIKPLYHAQVGETLWFGSELKALLAHPGFPREIDPLAVYQYFCLRYIPAPGTIYRAARKLPPGHLLIARKGCAPRIERYWDVPEMGGDDRPVEVIEAELLEAVHEVVRLRLVSDVPLGAFLSGGLDSSAVVASMSRTLDTAVKTCTVGFADADHDESRYSAELASQLGADHRCYDATADPLLALTTLPWFYDEPFADSSAVPTYLVSRLARERVTVALSGDGGDENFAGYRRYPYDVFENRLRRLLPRPIRRAVFGLLGHIYPKGDYLPQPLRAKTLLTNLARDPFDAYARSVAASTPEQVLAMLAPDRRRELRDVDPFDVLRGHYDRAPSSDPLERILYLDLKTYLVDDILTKVDRASMAVSLEVRVPLLDHLFVERAARIPVRHKLKGMRGKRIFKSALAGLLPRETIERQKHGFSVPLRRWVNHELRAEFDELVERLPEGWFDTGALRAGLERQRSGRSEHSEFFWALLMFERWYRCHHERTPAVAEACA